MFQGFEKSYLVYYTHTQGLGSLRNQIFFSRKQTFTLSGTDHGDIQFISVGHVMLTNEELYFSEVAWLGELEIKDCGREVIQNQNRAKGNKSNKLLIRVEEHILPLVLVTSLGKRMQLLALSSPGQDERDLFPLWFAGLGSPYALKP